LGAAPLASESVAELARVLGSGTDEDIS
jgi:hypothetical protein